MLGPSFGTILFVFLESHLVLGLGLPTQRERWSRNASWIVAQQNVVFIELDQIKPNTSIVGHDNIATCVVGIGRRGVVVVIVVVVLSMIIGNQREGAVQTVRLGSMAKDPSLLAATSSAFNKERITALCCAEFLGLSAIVLHAVVGLVVVD